MIEQMIGVFGSFFAYLFQKSCLGAISDRKYGYAICTGVSFILATGLASAESRKLILIPGMLGSKLCDVNNRTVWGDRYSYTLPRMLELRLPPGFDPENVTLHKCGIIETVNMLPLFWESDVYTSLLEFLKKS